MTKDSNSAETILPVPGVRLSAVEAGISSKARNDLVLLELVPGSTTAGTFTKNAFCAAPVSVTKEHMDRDNPRYFLVNSGNANAGMGDLGLRDARDCCKAIADFAGVSATEVLPFSTGVIGERLPVALITRQIPALFESLSDEGWLASARAIMTTDTRPKICSRQVEIAGRQITVSGMAKGAGMIRPDMATLLVFLATDASVEGPLLRELLVKAVNRSFNRVTIDSDTSTNDSCVIAATHQSGAVVSKDESSADDFSQALDELCMDLARQIVKDAEGATKFVEVKVENGSTSGECLAVAYSVAESPLVKTAMFASDANWGRILMAVGKSGVEDLSVDLISIYLGSVRIVHNGQRDESYREDMGADVMARKEIEVRIDLGRGACQETVWTSDLSHEYVSINADYRT